MSFAREEAMTRTTGFRLRWTLAAAALGLVVGCDSAAEATVPELEELPLPCAVSSPTGVYAETWRFSLTSAEACGAVSLLTVERLAWGGIDPALRLLIQS
jgi:hypothetical protein